ncbi:MAG: hypothetical protein ACLQFR_06100, partial [Streptosporangiaceae bacterium]
VVEGDEERFHGAAERHVALVADRVHGAHGWLTLPIAEKQAEWARRDRRVFPGRFPWYRRKSSVFRDKAHLGILPGAPSQARRRSALLAATELAPDQGDTSLTPRSRACWQGSNSSS